MPKWQSIIWVGLGVALIALLLSILILVAVTQMRVLTLIQEGIADRAFAVSMLSSSSLVLLRTIVVLVGGGISFAGLAVSFFAHEKVTSVSGGGMPALAMPKFQLASSSPGIIAIFVGAVVIVCALYQTTTTKYGEPPADSPQAVGQPAAGSTVLPTNGANNTSAATKDSPGATGLTIPPR